MILGCRGRSAGCGSRSPAIVVAAGADEEGRFVMNAFQAFVGKRIYACGAIVLALVLLMHPSGAWAGDQPRAMIGDQPFPSIQQAFDAAQDGDTVTILPGIWREGATVRAHNLTIEGTGAHLQDTAVGGKAALVIQGDNTLVRGLEVSGVSVPSRNGAAIRQEGRNLTLQNVHFHSSEQGVLAGNNPGSTIIVEDSRFERLGRDGQAHGIYVNRIDALVIRGSHFLRSQDQGHEIKSRATRTTIEYSVVAALDGNDSRLIDLPDGGVNVIRNNVLQQGPNSVNGQLIGVGLELRGGSTWPDNNTLIERNIIINDRRHGTNELVRWRDVTDPEIIRNIIIGLPPAQVAPGNTVLSLGDSGRISLANTLALLITEAPGAYNYFIDVGDDGELATLSRSVNPVPLPGALPLFVSALAALAFVLRRRRGTA
ncbi:MAG: hypothetical protein EA406_03180 [Rhodospirillales bacterium]|nr:MAG: hypothetical protein EA406_03180 [Rhodospirillales bacterium]